MDPYRYFIFNQRRMVVLGLLQVAFSTVCVVSGFIDGVFRAESELSQTRAPIWAGMVNAVITASVVSCATILIVMVYSSLTLSYGEEELNHLPIHAVHTKYILNRVVKGANIAMLMASVCSAGVVLVIAYLGCRSLPYCSCYDSVTGMVPGTAFLIPQFTFLFKTSPQRKTYPNLHHTSEWRENVMSTLKKLHV